MADQPQPYRNGVLDWLLERDDPNVRYLALRDLLEAPEDDPELLAARQAAYEQGPIASILAAMNREGYWIRPGPGYNPRYRSAVWSLIALSQLGASARHDERVRRACAYLLDHALADGGQFSYTGAPSGTIDCLQGNLCAALLSLGYDDPRLEGAFDWMACSVTGEGLAPATDQEADRRYFKSNCGPLFACSYNYGRPCAWGGVKILLAFSRLPLDWRTPAIRRAIQTGLDFLLGVDPARATYPTKDGNRPSRNWWKFGFPVFYVTDLLQNVEVLLRLGHAQDPRLEPALNLIREKQDQAGRWKLEHDYSGKTWGSYGVRNQPNKWVTLRALRVLKLASWDAQRN